MRSGGLGSGAVRLPRHHRQWQQRQRAAQHLSRNENSGCLQVPRQLRSRDDKLRLPLPIRPRRLDLGCCQRFRAPKERRRPDAAGKAARPPAGSGKGAQLEYQDIDPSLLDRVHTTNTPQRLAIEHDSQLWKIIPTPILPASYPDSSSTESSFRLPRLLLVKQGNAQRHPR